MSSDQPQAGLAAIPPSSCYGRVMEDILSGHLAPGAKIELADLMRRYFLSSGDLVAAIIRLAGDGLVALEGASALRIAPVSVGDLEELTESRVFVDCEALRRSVRLGGAAWRHGVEDSFARLSAMDHLSTGDDRVKIEAWELLNHGFHAALTAACPLGRLKAQGEHLYRQHERYRRLLSGRRAIALDVHQEHEALAAAALSGDGDQAAALLESHIRKSAATLAAGIADGSWFGTAPLY
ncbi:DNA-binding transcriptional regulator CsiR [mine drainage metagenome]|uniref:DNA-binding transcriptional regulator CsiR n=1 Tax=mine drainage metagenome TaxID=410659 RepID=A0A1J5QRN5_9ZZZZ